MPPKEQPSRPSQPKQQTPQKKQSLAASKPEGKKASTTASSQPAIPEYEIKQSSSMSAQLALEAAKKAYELRQAAYGAGDPNAREEILAKAINKEIEAEAFGKAAKYTRSGAFQGLAAGAGLGVQPGVTLGKLTGALVGGVLASAGAVIGGGIGSAYGAISGPFWDLGQMASHGVRSIVGDFPNWEATSSQKKALEKMVVGAQQTKAPDQRELEEIRDDDGGGSQEDYQQFARDLTSWIPSMPSMPSMPNMPNMPSIPGFGGQSKTDNSTLPQNKTTTATAPTQSQQPKAPARQAAPAKQKAPVKQESPAKPVTPAKQVAPAKQKAPARQEAPSKPPGTSAKATGHTPKSQPSQKTDENAVKKKPKKLEVRSTGTTSQPGSAAVRKAPPKLETRRKTATTNV